MNHSSVQLFEHIGALNLHFHNTNCLIIPRWLRGLYAFEKVINRLSLPWAQWPCLWHIFGGYPPTVTERAPATLRRHRRLYWSTSTTRGLKISLCGQTFLGHCPVGCFCGRPASVATRCLFPLKQTLSLRFIILNATLEVPLIHFFLCFGNHLVLLLIQKLHLQMFIKCIMLIKNIYIYVPGTVKLLLFLCKNIIPYVRALNQYSNVYCIFLRW